MSHHRVLHLESFPFSYGALASVEYRRRSKKVALHGEEDCGALSPASSSGSHGGAATGRRRAILFAHPRRSARRPRRPLRPAAFLVAHPRCSACCPRRSPQPSSSLAPASHLPLCSPRPVAILVARPSWPPSSLTCRRRAHGHARGRALPADSGHGHRLLPVAGGGHEIVLTGAGGRSHYPRGYCLLPFLGPARPGRLSTLLPRPSLLPRVPRSVHGDTAASR
jgi:hypothetical protein